MNKESRANKASWDHPDRLGSGEFPVLKATEENPDFQGKREKMENLECRVVRANQAKRVQRGLRGSRGWSDHEESRANPVNQVLRENQASPEILG